MRSGLAVGAGLIVSLLTITVFASGTPLDVAQIISKADAQKILGEPVRDPNPLNNEAGDGYSSKCNYYSSKSVRSLLIRVRQASAGSIDPQKEFEQVAASGGAMKRVEGLGDKAGMFDGTPQNGLPANVIMLYVVKSNAFITVGLGGMKMEPPRWKRRRLWRGRFWENCNSVCIKRGHI